MTSKGKLTFGGTWFNTDKRSIASQVTETIFNSRLLNKALKKEGQKMERHEEYDENSVLHKMFIESGKDSNYFDSTQHIDKIDINSLYGQWVMYIFTNIN
jgi:ferric iron reductase protein FhuF